VSPHEGDVQRISHHCLRLWDGPACSGHTHAQSRRFLDPNWTGLSSESQDSDPPLRELVVAVADGATTMADIMSGESLQEQSFVEWVSAFRLASWLPCSELLLKFTRN
jgi:hypothetical protein